MIIYIDLKNSSGVDLNSYLQSNTREDLAIDNIAGLSNLLI